MRTGMGSLFRETGHPFGLITTLTAREYGSPDKARSLRRIF